MTHSPAPPSAISEVKRAIGGLHAGQLPDQPAEQSPEPLACTDEEVSMSFKSFSRSLRKARLGLFSMMATFAVTRAFQLLPAARRAIVLPSTYCAGSRSSSSAAGVLCRNRISGVTIIRSSSPTSPIARFMSQTSSSLALTNEQKAELELKIKDKGVIIRSMKDQGVSKDELAPHVSELLSLKALLNPSSASPQKKGEGHEEVQEKQKQQQQQQQSKKEVEDVESDYITPRSENYSKWYNDIIRVCALAETSPVRGCMVIKPWGMSIWDRIRIDLDARIQEHGAENAYFPLLIPKSFLSKEAEHVDGFAKECAVVTHHRLTVSPDGKGLIADPEAELEDPLIIRPTSETMIWSMFKKWIVSHR